METIFGRDVIPSVQLLKAGDGVLFNNARGNRLWGFGKVGEDHGALTGMRAREAEDVFVIGRDDLQLAA